MAERINGNRGCGDMDLGPSSSRDLVHGFNTPTAGAPKHWELLQDLCRGCEEGDFPSASHGVCYPEVGLCLQG